MADIPIFNAPPEYYELWRYSIENPEGFWAEMAEKSMSDIYWLKKWDRILEKSTSEFKWFTGGRTNTGYNCVDYKLGRYRDKIAYIQESPEFEITRVITYGELFDTVVNYTAALRNLGIKKGDRVLFYIPNNIEAAAMLQACARMGAISTCVFAGFSPGALADRIQLTKPKAIFTQDFTLRRGVKIQLKEAVDEALKICSQEINERVEFIIISSIDAKEASQTSNRDITLVDFREKGRNGDKGYIELESNEPLLIMCTSGTTAKPKPVVHVHGGFQIWTYWTARWVYDIKPEDVMFNTSDIGWIVGQSYLIFAPLLVGCSVILYEGTPDFPEPDMWWKIIEKHKATILWTAPTGAKALRNLGVKQAEKHNLNSLERIVVAGEVLNPEVWSWMYRDLFKGKVPVFDHMWQTEIPGSMFGYPYGVKMPDIRPGSVGFPMPGILPEIVDEREGKSCGVNEKGILLLKEPVPGMTQTLWEDPETYRKEYWDTQPITKGRYFTGDCAFTDEDGYIWFCGRSDEVIKIAAHRIGPTEVESALISHPAVSEAAVFGVPDDLRGQVAVAFVVLKQDVEPSDDLKEELVRYVRKAIGPIVVFREVQFCNLLPKTRSGKIMRRVMRKLWTGEDLGDLSTIENEASVDEVKEAISRLIKIGD